jgi:FtsP/CotA-like multicopper oxidase with cupredoxin domain
VNQHDTDEAETDADASRDVDRDRSQPRWTRRSFIGGAAGAAAVGLAACSSDGDDSGGSTTTGSEPAPTDTPAGTDRPAGTDAPTSTDAAPGTTTTTVPDIPGTNLKATTGETWNNGWVWRPTGNPTDVLNLYVVENLTTIALTGGNLDGSLESGTPLLFSWNGVTPGPTIRMKGDETLYLKLYNQLGPDLGESFVGPNPDIAAGPFPGQEGQWVKADNKLGLNVFSGRNNLEPCKIPNEPIEDWCLGEHVNGIHSVHVTNIHTHGLHVAPGRTEIGEGPDGTPEYIYSDDIYARIIPRGDAARGIADQKEKARMADPPEDIDDAEAYRRFVDECFPTDQVEVGEANYQFVLGGTERVPVHPPGTHWYHPHTHGATHQQVAGGMAGFLIVEGDVDENVNEALAGTPEFDPDVPTGDWEYRERTILIQRIFNNPAVDPDAPEGSTPKALQGTTFPVVNGTFNPGIMVMSPGAVERWRILNGSVDGGGFFRVAVLKGEYVAGQNGLVPAVADANGQQKAVVTSDYWPVVLAEDSAKPTNAELESENLKAHLWQLSHDGITLVDEDGNYFVKDLDGDDVNLGADATLESCYVANDNTDNLAACYSRPNEIRMTTGNRADVFFQAPPLEDPDTSEVYTLLGLPTLVNGNPSTPIIAAYIIVRGDEVANAQHDFDFASIDLPPVPDYLKPIGDNDPGFLDANGQFRTRTVSYAGWGPADMPQIIADEDFTDANPDLEKLIWYTAPPRLDCGSDPTGKIQGDRKQNSPKRVGEGAKVFGDTLPALVIPPDVRTMSIDGMKFDPGSTDTPRMELNTVEEWAVFNRSIDCYGTPDDENEPDQIWYSYDEDETPQVYFPGHRVSHPLRLADVPDGWKNSTPPEIWPIGARVTKAVDHPFHIHQNPFWLLRVDVPDENGNLVNVLPQPQWGDVQWIPRNGGRILFRSRFDDYSGELVNHCHILKHEDNGMMQRIQVVPDPESSGPQDPNYDAEPEVYRTTDPGSADRLYPAPKPAECWQSSAMFVDPNPNTGQTFPGFTPEPPPPPSS